MKLLVLSLQPPVNGRVPFGLKITKASVCMRFHRNRKVPAGQEIQPGAETENSPRDQSCPTPFDAFKHGLSHCGSIINSNELVPTARRKRILTGRLRKYW